MKCHYCGRAVFEAKRVEAKRQPEITATRDHIRPKCMGGDYNPNNLVIACSQCNNLRGDTPYELYYAFSKMYTKMGVASRRTAYRNFLHDMAIFGVTTAIDEGLLNNYKFGGVK